MKVLITGAFGQVGRETVKALLLSGHDVTAYELPSKRNRDLAERSGVKTVWGDLRDGERVREAVDGKDAVVHLGAVIPPLADREPVLAREVNVDGTANVVRAVSAAGGKAKLLFSSSIAVYGDRLSSPLVAIDDPPNPNVSDGYAHHKLECESLIRASGLRWSILRLSYIVSVGALKFMPLMFEMPLATSLEICHARDVAAAFTAGITEDRILGKTLLIAGGPSCRTTFGEYLARMSRLFGLGNRPLSSSAFGSSGFHCAFMDTSESQELLSYQRCSLEDFFREVEREYAARRFFVSLVRPLARGYLESLSPYLKKRRAYAAGSSAVHV